MVGLKDLPAALSVTWLLLVPPTTFSEPIGLELSGRKGYLDAQLFAGIMYLISALFLWLLKAWKVGDLERVAAMKARLRGDGDDMPQSGQSIGRGEVAPGSATDRDEISPFIKRLLVWQHV